MTDHIGIFHLIYGTPTVHNIKYKQTRQLNEYNILKFRNLLAKADYTSVLSAIDPNEAYNNFMQIYKSLFEISCPVKTTKIKIYIYIKREPWMTSGLLVSSINKETLLRRKLHKPNMERENAYRAYCRIYNKTKRAAKTNYYAEILEERKYSIKDTWIILRQVISKQKVRLHFPETFSVNGEKVSNYSIITEEFNNFFAKIGKTVSESVPSPTTSFHSHLQDRSSVNVFMQPTDIYEIKNVVTNLKTKCTVGFDSLSTKLIQQTIGEIIIPLRHIINQSFVTGVVPENLKVAKVIPIYKSGNKNVFNNYRPISILPALSKIMEKIVCNRLVNYLEKYNILYKHQYGFRSKHSTIHPILHFLKDIADANDKLSKDITMAVFLDLSKAFDTINHDVLLYKLCHYGIRGISNKWFSSYLSNRKQYIEMNECKSPVITLTHGVPQGSILGPVLFLIYINDISNSTSLNLLSFADDTTIYHSVCDIDNLTLTLNHELKNIYNWLCANKLCLNVKKTQYCIFSPKNSNYEVKGSVKINNEVINQIGKYNKDESVKFLGIYIDKHLTWKEHINIISSKISRAIFAINRVKHILPHKSLKSLYYTLIHSHITYGIQAWGNGNTKKLDILQKRALRIINKKRI